MAGGLVRVAQAALRRLGLRIVKVDSAKPWDAHFSRWIADARARGIDPNDIGDAEWRGNPLELAEKHYFPHIRPDSVVLELGPGTGRLTRHAIGRCREMLLVDYSTLVCDWLEGYLAGKGRFRTYRIETPALPAIEGGTVDMAFASGVFHHVDLYDMYLFFEEFLRVLRPRGALAFNFVHTVSDKGLEWFKQNKPRPGGKSVWKFHHPDDVRRLVEAAGFETLRLTVTESLIGFMEARKPG